jgi:hypothetical protein
MSTDRLRSSACPWSRSGSYSLHCLEPMYRSLWVAVYDTWITMSDAPPATVRHHQHKPCTFCAARLTAHVSLGPFALAQPITHLGGAIVMASSFAGVLAMAAITASLTSAAELGADEAWLVRRIETHEELRRRERCALALMQACFREWSATRQMKRASPSATDAEELANQLDRAQRARREAAVAFRLVAGRIARLTRVTTLAVLHTNVDKLRDEQRRLNNRLDKLVGLAADTAKSVQALHGARAAKAE